MWGQKGRKYKCEKMVGEPREPAGRRPHRPHGAARTSHARLALPTTRPAQCKNCLWKHGNRVENMVVIQAPTRVTSSRTLQTNYV